MWKVNNWYLYAVLPVSKQAYIAYGVWAMESGTLGLIVIVILVNFLVCRKTRRDNCLFAPHTSYVTPLVVGCSFWGLTQLSIVYVSCVVCLLQSFVYVILCLAKTCRTHVFEVVHLPSAKAKKLAHLILRHLQSWTAALYNLGSGSWLALS